MEKIAIELLKLIEEKGFQAYIVGGYVRDRLIEIASLDIDITTNAKPIDLKKIFKNISIPKQNSNDNYGSVTVTYKNIPFEITTFRREAEYLDNRHPSSIEYVDDLEIDLVRRDFTVNTLCMNSNGEVIDLLNGLPDLHNRMIKTVIDSVKSFSDDALRILRAIRFAVTLNFTLDKEVIEAIHKCKPLLKNISYERKKSELDKIFGNLEAKKGIDIIKSLELDRYLDLPNLERINDYSDLIGIWSMINPISYPFTKVEKELIKKINEAYKENNLDPFTLYKYGLYVNTIAGINKNLMKKEITEHFNKLPITERNDIKITAREISSLLGKKPGVFLKEIYLDLESNILKGTLQNEKAIIQDYIIKNYI